MDATRILTPVERFFVGAGPDAHEQLAEHLRNNGYHVVTRDRVKKLTVSRMVNLDTLAFYRDNEGYLDHVRYRMGQVLANEILRGPCVLWSDYDHELRRVYQASMCLITPKD